jgi:hypothetical protein
VTQLVKEREDTSGGAVGSVDGNHGSGTIPGRESPDASPAKLQLKDEQRMHLQGSAPLSEGLARVVPSELLNWAYTEEAAHFSCRLFSAKSD